MDRQPRVISTHTQATVPMFVMGLDLAPDRELIVEGNGTIKYCSTAKEELSIRRVKEDLHGVEESRP